MHPGEDTGDFPDARAHKAKVRRLYDIANILAALHLVSRKQGHKTIYVWQGPLPDDMMQLQLSQHQLLSCIDAAATVSGR